MTALPEALPQIRRRLTELAPTLVADEVRRLVFHDSIGVYYQADLDPDGMLTLTELPTTTARAALILPTLAQLADRHGGKLSVLDLACSPGYFMFKLAQMGFADVTGVDAREDHHAQFNLLQGAYGFPGVRHVHADIYEFLRSEAAAGRRYDVCLLFGFLYHTATPVELLRLIRAVCRQALMIDTTVSRRGDCTLQLYEERIGWSRASTTKLSMLPSPRAVPMLLEAAEFTDVQRIPAAPQLRDRNPGGDKVDYYFDDRPAAGLRYKLARLGLRVARRVGLVAEQRKGKDGRVLYIARA